MKMIQYNRTGLPREIKPKPTDNILNYILWGIVILFVLWWIMKG